MNWYKFTPIDTIFFRGAEPMTMGESHTSKINFPPPLPTIIGAIRTTILRERNISIEDYYNNKVDNEIIKIIGKAGEKESFLVIGCLFEKDDNVYIPVPFSWYKEKQGNNKILKIEKIDSKIIKSDKEIYWIKNSNSEVETLGGKWIKLKDFNDNNDNIQVESVENFYDIEERTGIALDTKVRYAREGHLYTFNHIRLKKGVSIVFGIDKDILKDRGEMKVGAEQRFGEYKRIEKIEFKRKPDTDSYMTLSIIEGNDETNQSVIATGKPLYLGGWDLKKGFHKPMKGYFPAGSVFNKKINENFIKI